MLSHQTHRAPRSSTHSAQEHRESIWVCLKIVYPYTQWLMIIIPIKWLFHWEYILFSDKPIWCASSFKVFVLYSLYSCDFPSTLAATSSQVQLEESSEGMKVRGLGDAVPIRAGAPWVFLSRFFVAYLDLAIERLVGVLRIFSFTYLYIAKRIWIIRSQGQRWIRFHMIPLPLNLCFLVAELPERFNCQVTCFWSKQSWTTLPRPIPDDGSRGHRGPLVAVSRWFRCRLCSSNHSGHWWLRHKRLYFVVLLMQHQMNELWLPCVGNPRSVWHCFTI